MLLPILLMCAVTAATCVPLQQEYEYSRQNCGYQNCPRTDPDVLNVHIVAHTHDDVGWLKTVDQYYYGSKNLIQKAGVQYILDSVVKELWADPKRKFIYVETAFFWKWWVRQPEEVQQKVRTLVREGRLQFVGGAWSMNDEAATHYQSTIDQFTWGLSKINETFGPCALPRVGWQIDPFGHSREFASLLAGMGYDGLFLGRIDYEDKATRLQHRTMEMIWRGDDDLGKSSDIFTGVLYNTYSPPPGFCFDVLCADEPIIDDPDSPMFNVDEKVKTFIELARNMSKGYLTNNILVTMGEDFNYQDAAMWYTNLDKLIQYTNLKAAKDGLNIKLFYSTPNCYLKAVKDANPKLPTKSDDFFPYASDPHAFWTGYFTSRPTTKQFERQGNAYLQMAKQLQVLARLEKHNEFVINGLKSAMGIMQHHDAITGTEKQHVTKDYVRILDQAIEDSLLIPRQALNKMMSGKPDATPVMEFNRCRLNESSCAVSEENDNLVVTIYNPLGWKRILPIRLPVHNATFEVYQSPNGFRIPAQLIDIPKQILDIPNRKSSATHELVFVTYLRPLSYTSYYVKKVKKVKREVEFAKPKRVEDVYTNINDYWKDIREKAEIVIKNLEEKDQVPDDGISSHDAKAKEFEENDRIPEEPTFSKDIDMKHVNYANLDILKDKDGLDSKVKDLEKIIKEETKEVKRMREFVNSYPNLNDDEMRMLSDDPKIVEMADEFFVMEKDNISLRIDTNTGAVKSLNFKGRDVDFTYNFYYYPGCIGNNELATNRSSGAYIFRPNATQPIPLKNLGHQSVISRVVNEYRTTWSDNAFTVLRQYDGADFIEFEWLVGPIDVSDGIGKEYVLKYETSIVNNGEFYTDSNSRQMMKRKLDHRPQYNLTLAEPIAGNYYPVTNEIYIEDDKMRMTVMTDRPQGGTSLIEGEIELMLHRRLLHDDAFGVDEALNEEEAGKGLVVRGTHRLLINDKYVARMQAIEMDLPPITFVSKTDLDKKTWVDQLTTWYTWIKTDLPAGLHLLTVEPWGDKLLLRLENYMTTAVDSDVKVDLANIFVNIEVKGYKEAVLSANEWVDAREPWVWRQEGNDSNDNDRDDNDKRNSNNGNERRNSNERDNGFVVLIKGKQIRTFIVDYEYSK